MRRADGFVKAIQRCHCQRAAQNYSPSNRTARGCRGTCRALHGLPLHILENLLDTLMRRERHRSVHDSGVHRSPKVPVDDHGRALERLLGAGHDRGEEGKCNGYCYQTHYGYPLFTVDR